MASFTGRFRDTTIDEFLGYAREASEQAAAQTLMSRRARLAGVHMPGAPRGQNGQANFFDDNMLSSMDDAAFDQLIGPYEQMTAKRNADAASTPWYKDPKYNTPGPPSQGMIGTYKNMQQSTYGNAWDPNKGRLKSSLKPMVSPSQPSMRAAGGNPKNRTFGGTSVFGSYNKF